VGKEAPALMMVQFRTRPSLIKASHLFIFGGLDSLNKLFLAFSNWSKKILRMADEKPEVPRPVGYVRQARDIALGVHPWSRFGAPLLLLADALLTSLIISKVACKSLPIPLSLNNQWLICDWQIPRLIGRHTWNSLSSMSTANAITRK
jgi:hypothetical protein